MNNTIDMLAVKAKAESLSYDIVKVKRELKRIASAKCRLKQNPRKATFNDEMTKTLQEEYLLKAVKDLINGPRKNVNTLTQDEVDKMNPEEVIKAIRAIQSKKYHTRWLNDEEGNNDDYREACRIEEMLKRRRESLSHSSNATKYSVQKLLDVLKTCDDLSTEDCIKRIEAALNEGGVEND